MLKQMLEKKNTPPQKKPTAKSGALHSPAARASAPHGPLKKNMLKQMLRKTRDYSAIKAL
jgi:hypothetical protein